MLFGIEANESSVHPIKLEKSHSSVLLHYIPTFVFLQPQISTAFLLHHKTTHCSIAKYLGNF
ncbi:hypothetical protein FBFR_06115 [Flavobacterium fryxellicola]|uniref:Uncharacterized protein n=1 Tax=Flavobacterium fryxellicola TaxID=249352 RepID=A0A162P6X9_9FLAO|nr:hypothetical protein FBFR_06115 [Flavobacterium fryxellicola]